MIIAIEGTSICMQRSFTYNHALINRFPEQAPSLVLGACFQVPVHYDTDSYQDILSG